MAKCRSCGEEISFVETQSGKKMPVNKEQVAIIPFEGGHMTIVTDKGRVVKGRKVDMAEVATGKAIVGHVSHFATCPYADQHRRR